MSDPRPGDTVTITIRGEHGETVFEDVELFGITDGGPDAANGGIASVIVFKKSD